MPELKDIELRDWKEYDRAVAEGYDAAREAIAGLKGPLKALMSPEEKASETPP